MCTSLKFYQPRLFSEGLAEFFFSIKISQMNADLVKVHTYSTTIPLNFCHLIFSLICNFYFFLDADAYTDNYQLINFTRNSAKWRDFLRWVGADCVEIKLRWRFYVHASTCPEIYFWSYFWIIFDVSNTKPWLGFAQKHIWNTIEDLSLKRVKKDNLKKTFSSIMFQICFWANLSQDLVFEISKII